LGQGSRLTRQARRKLIVATVLFQTATLGAAWYVTLIGVRNHVSSAMAETLLDHAAQTAGTLANAISEMDVNALESKGADWQRLQTVIEQYRTSAGGYATIIGPDGQVICHPELAERPGWQAVQLGRTVLTDRTGIAGPMISDVPPGAPATGRITLASGEQHVVAVKAIAKLGVQLVIHQPERLMLDFSSGSMRVAVFGAAAMGMLALGATAWATAGLMRRHDRQLEQINSGLEQQLGVRLEQSLRNRHALITGLAKLADYRDTDTGTHLDRIAAYSVLLARELRSSWWFIDDAWTERLALSSSLHDIGKVGIADHILLKPGKLTPEERTIMERHATIGAETLAAVRSDMGSDDLLDMCIEIARHHHERWDGAGYPSKLAGSEIPHAARLVALADVYDALTSKRVYKKAMPHDEVVAMIERESGKHFDPDVVRAFLALKDKFNHTRAMLQPHDGASVDMTPQELGSTPRLAA